MPTLNNAQTSTVEVVFSPKARTVLSLTLEHSAQESVLNTLSRALRHDCGEENLLVREQLIATLGLMDFPLNDPDLGSASHLAKALSHSLKERHFFLSVWGHPQELNHRLKLGDRLEITRPLRVDPKVARRERFAKQGAKAAGLFAKKRPQAKAGY